MIKKILLVFFSFVSAFGSAQNRKKADSLLATLNAAVARDTNLVKKYNELSYHFAFLNADSSRLYRDQCYQLGKQLAYPRTEMMAMNNKAVLFHSQKSFDSAIKYFLLTFDLKKELKDKSGMASTQNNIALVNFNAGRYEDALHAYENALRLLKEIKNEPQLASTYNSMAAVFIYKADYDRALNCYVNAQKIFEKRNDKPGLAQLYNNLAIVYQSTSNREKAIDHYNKALELAKEVNDKATLASALGNLGILYREAGNNEKALQSFTQSLEYARQLGDQDGISSGLLNIGSIHLAKKEFETSRDFYDRALQISLEVTEPRAIADCYVHLGELFLQMNQVAEAKKNLESALDISRKTGLNDITLQVYSHLSVLYKLKKDFKKSYAYITMYSELRDSVINEEKSRNMAEMQERFNTEKKQGQIESLTRDKKIKELEMIEQKARDKKQKIVLFVSGAGILLALAMVFFILKGYQDKKKANALLEEKNEAIIQQKKILEDKNVLVTDSIEYAKGIQETILPPDEEVRKALPGSFIFYKPKDIVAGDFYWLYETGEGNTRSVFFAACDCTGHGVPGAFMSMHGYYLLERIMKEKNILHPSGLLDELNKEMVDTLHQTSRQASAKYGIDMALLKISGRQVEYAGARNPLVIVHNNELKEIKADGIYIGGSKEKFSNHSLELEKGSMLYLFTDGYADQKGGAEKKKYFSTSFRELLLSISSLPVEEQKQKLEETFESWKGGMEQIDDVLVIGIKIV
jgi:serine phosphatase RsbU (regulator of sigma subunit)/Tfp pilus assembly protein PilF